MLVSSCVGCSGLQAEMVFVLFFNSSPQCRHWMCDLLPIWSDSSCRYAKDQSHNVWFRADSAFSLSPEVWKNISRQDSDFSPAHSLASDLILSLPMLLVCLGLFHVHYSAVPKITYPSFTWRMQWVQRDGLREARAMITGRCKGKKPRRVGGVLQPSQRSTNSMCTFPSTCAYFLYSCTAANESWAEAWCCVARCRPVLLFPSSEPEASCARISVTAAAFPLMGSHSSLCVQHSDLCCCGSPASACHFQHGSVWIRVGEIGAEGGVLPLWAHHTAASSLQPRGSVHQCRGGRKGNVSVTMWQGCSDRAVLVHRVDKSQPAQSLLQPWVASHEPPRTASWRPLGRAGWRALLPALLHWLIGILSATKATKFVLFC